MIRVLVMAKESIFADFIISILSQEKDLDVFRMTRDELGMRRDYSVVIVVDEGMSGGETIKLKEIIRDDKTLLVIRMSLQSRNVYVDEEYELINPGMEQVVELVRDFSRKNLKLRSEEEPYPQKKMNDGRNKPTKIHDRQKVNFPVEYRTTMVQADDLEAQPSTRVNRLPLLFEAWNSFTSLSLRRNNPGSVTLLNSQGYSTGNNK